MNDRTTERQREALVLALTELVERWESFGLAITENHVRDILRSPRLTDLVAKTIQNPKELFSEQLEEMARCMKVLVEDDITLADLRVCLLEEERFRSALTGKIREISNWRDLS